jgi:hypothetical protein
MAMTKNAGKASPKKSVTSKVKTRAGAKKNVSKSRSGIAATKQSKGWASSAAPKKRSPGRPKKME